VFPSTNGTARVVLTRCLGNAKECMFGTCVGHAQDMFLRCVGNANGQLLACLGRRRTVNALSSFLGAFEQH